jgi:hypothetical protein
MNYDFCNVNLVVYIFCSSFFFFNTRYDNSLKIVYVFLIIF